MYTKIKKTKKNLFLFIFSSALKYKKKYLQIKFYKYLQIKFYKYLFNKEELI